MIATNATTNAHTNQRLNPFKTMASNGESAASRVPTALQSVFIAANRGKEVSKPPPNQIASRTFRRRFFSGRPKFEPNTSISSIENDQNTNNRQTPPSPPPCMQRSPSFLISPTRSSKKSVNMSALIAATEKPSTQHATTHHVSPQSYCSSLLKTRGYSTTSYRSLDTGYYNKPTALQVASYGIAVTEAIKSGNANLLRDLMDIGLSPNACNAHGESIVHMACRNGKKECLEVLMDFGCSVQVADDYGRTPLHDACFCREPNFELVDLILEQDCRLLYIEDSKGALPLSYLRSEQWTAWTKYLMSRKDRFWPDRDITTHGLEADPPRTLEGPNARLFPDPKDALAPELVRMVANKRMDPMEAALLKDDLYDSSSNSGSVTDDLSSSFDESCDFTDDASDEEEDDDDDEDDDDEDLTREDYDEDSSDSSGFDESELEQILGCIGKGQAIAWSS